ncbi:hypothetical protein QFC21_003147 [Naganishia friedmannii]|uniref:Uncharacterized protein n=1 Tax=Naganishia friedmannii TaxID=89922 RepID=A0ACC2VRR0_9TREE|nr:hypothetical protein QFC21_003147 [Naganishia friedmannii]
MSYHSDRDRRDSSRGRTRGFDDPPEDYKARVELIDLPGFLLEDRPLCKRFVNHYFTRLTHFPIDEVELVQMEDTSSEAGEIAGLRCYINLPEKDALARLTAAAAERVRLMADHNASGRPHCDSSQTSELDTEWTHYYNSKYMPTWSLIQRYQGNIQGESIRQLLYSRKVTFRIDRVASSPQLPRPPFVLHDDTRRAPTRRNNISSVRAIDRRPAEPESAVERGRPVESVRAEIVGPKDAGRPVSWDVEDGQLDDVAAQQKSARSASRQGSTSQADLRPADDFVGFPEHNETTDPWNDRHLDGSFEENLRWLERYREYLLRPEIGAVKPSTIIPSFVEDRTVVVWQLAKTWRRIDDVKIRQVAEGWVPAGRIGYISFMSQGDRQEILRKCTGYNFPKQVVRLRETAHWKVADDLQNGGPPCMLVGQAKEGEWCPIASKLVNGKWDPAAAGRERYVYKPVNPFPKRPVPTGPLNTSRDSLKDSLDYSSHTTYDEPPAGPSDRESQRSLLSNGTDYSPKESYGTLPPPVTASGHTSPRSPRRRRMSSARPDVCIYLPVDFGVKRGSEKIPGPADNPTKLMRVLAIPDMANEEQMKKMFQQFGSVEKIEIFAYAGRSATVRFRAFAGTEAAERAARKPHQPTEFSKSYDLPVRLTDLQPAEEAIWIEWDRKNRSDVDPDEGSRPTNRSSRNPPKLAAAAEPSGSARAILPAANVQASVPETESAAEPMDETSALLDDALAPSHSPSPPPEPIAAARLPPPPPPAAISARASTADELPSSDFRTIDADSAAHVRSVYATSTNATALGAASAPRPAIAAPPPQPARASSFLARLPGRARIQSAARSAMAALVASQVGLLPSEPAKRPSDEEDAIEATAAKRGRFE